MPNTSADTLPTNPNPTDPQDHAPTVAPSTAPDGGGTNGAAASSEGAPLPVARRGRGRPRKSSQGAKAPRTAKPKPLSDDELQALGVLTLRAQKAKQPLGDYAEEMRLLLGAYDRMRELAQ